MNKQQALEKLAALEAETEALRAIIEAPEPADGLLPNVKGYDFWFPDETQRKTLWFHDKDQRDDYMKAFETMLDLRRQPGSETPKGGVRQWSIGNYSGEIEVDSDVDFDVKVNCIAPYFSTKEQAEAAIKTVGGERIRHMFNTLHGVK